MLVKLRRDLFIGEYFFKARPAGVEIPDVIDGKPVVAHSEKGEGKISLPKDAVILNAPVPQKAKKQEPTALSEIATKQASPQSFVSAMKKDDD